MRLLSRAAVVAVVGSFTTLALAQESEFQGKIQEDLDSYKGDVVKWCGTTSALTIKYSGKLGSNPRETKQGDYSGVSSLCTGALEGLAHACRNDAVKGEADEADLDHLPGRQGNDDVQPEEPEPHLQRRRGLREGQRLWPEGRHGREDEEGARQVDVVGFRVEDAAFIDHGRWRATSSLFDPRAIRRSPSSRVRTLPSAYSTCRRCRS